MLQSTILYGQNISISFENITIKTALKKLDNTISTIDFSFNNELPALNKNISKNYQNKSLHYILNDLLENLPLQYKKVGKTIAIFENKNYNSKQTETTISGYVYDESTGEALIGATVYLPNKSAGTATNSYGFYSLSIPNNTTEIIISYLGYEELKMPLNDNKTINVKLKVAENKIVEVVVKAKKTTEIEQFAGAESISMKEVKRLPLFMGEPDIIKAVQQQNGIKTITDGASFYYVRGGNFDQNLVLLDEAPIYSPSHLMGLTSVINGDIIKDTKLYKGHFPVKYSGKIASIMDITSKDGNNKSFNATGGISAMGVRLMLEGPILKNKISFMVSARKSWIELFKKAIDFSPAYYDVNAKLHYNVNAKNKIYLSFYHGADHFSVPDPKFSAKWNNILASLRWNHLYSTKTFANTSFVFNTFGSTTDFEKTKTSFRSKIFEYRAKHQITHYINNKHKINGGIKIGYHIFEPGKLNNNSLDMGKKQMLNINGFVGHRWKIIPALTIDYGINLNLTSALGKTKLYTLDHLYNVIDTTQNKGGIYKNWFGIEPRINVQYQINKKHKIFASYARMQQFVHSLYPFQNDYDMLKMWIPVSNNVKPLISDIVSIGYNLAIENFGANIETYYKHIQNQLDYTPYPDVLTPTYEKDLRSGNVNAYGVEVSLGYKTKKWGVKADYSYSKAMIKNPSINNGKSYVARYDIPHQINLTAHYTLFKRLTFSAFWKYSTGKPFTLPVSTQLLNGGNTIVPLFGNIHNARFSDYHRLDLMISYKHKKLFKRWEGTINAGIINAYGRSNPVAVHYNYNNNRMKPNTEVIYRFLPILSYNFKF